MRIVKAIVGWACIAALVVFMFMNTERVAVEFFDARMSAALGVFVLMAAALGALSSAAVYDFWRFTRKRGEETRTGRGLRIVGQVIRWLGVAVLVVFVFMNMHPAVVRMPSVSIQAPIGYILLVAALFGALGRSGIRAVLSWTVPPPRKNKKTLRDMPVKKNNNRREHQSGTADKARSEEPPAHPGRATARAERPVTRVRGMGGTHPGRERTSNEDAFVIDDAHGLYLVCDGMGGHAAGEVASALASSAVVRVLHQHMPADRAGRTPVAVQALVSRAIREGAHAIADAAAGNPTWSGMGCALTLVQFVDDHTAVMGHVGDTRLYHYHYYDGHVTQVSHDHSVAAELARRGVSEPGLATGVMAHTLTRCVGPEPNVEVDTQVVAVSQGDVLLLCSDGLGDYIDRPDDLARLLEHPFDQLPDRLIQHANQAGGHDNVTALVIRID